MTATALEQRLKEMLAPLLEAAGYDIVSIRFSEGKNAGLHLAAERKDGAPMSISDCERISYLASAKLDVEDPIAGPYQLEVSSPGENRALESLEDFRRFAGQSAKLELKLPREGRRRFSGTVGVDGESVMLTHPEGQWKFTVEEIHQACLQPEKLPKRAGKKHGN